MTDARFVYITAASEDEAAAIADHLIDQRLAACVGILPGLQTRYRWEGKVCHGQEVALFAKTTEKLVTALTEAVKKLHSYDCPCIVSLPIEGGFSPYLKWIEDQCLTER